MPRTIAIYPGTFDPLTLGHLDVLKRASKMFDEVIISVVKNSSKSTLLSLDERTGIIEEVIKEMDNCRVEGFDGLLVNYAKEKNENVEAKRAEEITFECRFCGMAKPLKDMRFLTRFFPPLVACRDCEKKMD